MKLSDYDFLDLGASKGGSIRFASKIFGGRGCGIDISPDKIEQLKANGFEGIVGDATELDVPDNSVGFVTMMHFLEHLPNAEVGEKVIDSAVRVARDFVLMTGPDFENEEMLRRMEFKRYYADWHGHRWHHTAPELGKMLAKHPYRWSVMQSDRIASSQDPSILPIAAPMDRGAYDPATDAPKANMLFQPGLFRTLSFALVKSDRYSVNDILLQILRPRIRMNSASQAKVRADGRGTK